MTDSDRVLVTEEREPWKDADLMFRLYDDEGLTYSEMADRFGCADSTINSWMMKHRAEEIREEIDVEIPDEEPYKDEETMRALYEDEELSTTQISAVLGCSTGAATEWLGKLGIDTRSRSDAMKISRRDDLTVTFYTHGSKGYEMVKGDEYPYPVHRLQAIAYWGIDAVKGNHVHHKDGIEWHNTEENLEVIGVSDHIATEHNGNIWLDKLRATEMYDEGASSYDLAPIFDVAPGTVIAWVRDVDDSVVRSTGGS